MIWDRKFSLWKPSFYWMTDFCIQKNCSLSWSELGILSHDKEVVWNFFLPFTSSFFQGLGKLNLLVVNIGKWVVLGFNITGGYLSNERDDSFLYTLASCLHLSCFSFYKSSFFCLAYWQELGYQLWNLMAEKLLPGHKSQWVLVAHSSVSFLPLSQLPFL